MSWFCTRCGSPNADSLKPCTVCGNMPAQAAPHTADPAWAQPSGAPAEGPGATQFAAPSGFAAVGATSGGTGQAGFGAGPAQGTGQAGFGASPAQGAGFGGSVGSPMGYAGSPMGAPMGYAGSPMGAPMGHAGSPMGAPMGHAGSPMGHAGSPMGYAGSPMGAPMGGPMGGPMGPIGQRSNDSNWKLGCGIAGCLGVVMVIGVVFAVMFLLKKDDRSSRAGPPDRGAQNEPSGPSASDNRTAPRSGNLRDSLPRTIGEFTLVSVQPVEVAGATEAVVAVYKSGSLQVGHGLCVFGSEAGAKAHAVGVVAKAETDAGSEGRPITIRDPNKQVIGEGRFFESNPEIFAYRVGRIVGLIHGPPGKVKEYFKNAPM